MPIRGTVALLATVVAVALMLSFKTPDLIPARAGKLPAAVGSPTPSDTGSGGGGSATPAPGASGSPSATAYRDGSYQGSDVVTRYGDVQVKVVINGGRISDVQPVQLPSDRQRSAFISEQAGPLLHNEALQAQSAQIDIVSGATYTSDGYAQSLQAALDKAHA